MRIIHLVAQTKTNVAQLNTGEVEMTSKERLKLAVLITNYGAACRNCGALWAKGEEASSDKEFLEMLNYLYSLEVTDHE
jgi:hypothetical protein